MDRNLGAMDIYYHGEDGHYGELYYQFGRKDPFSGPRQIYIRNEGGDFPYVSWSTSTYTIQNTTANANCNNVPYSIKHPLTFIKGTYWTYNDIYNPTIFVSSIRWQDPYVKDDAGKSMFDPCPAGWKVPKNGTWTGFNTSNFLWNNPLSPGRNDPNSSAFYSKTYVLSYVSGSLSNGWEAFYWSCSPNSIIYGHYLFFHASFIDTSRSGFGERGNGFIVRCVQE